MSLNAAIRLNELIEQTSRGNHGVSNWHALRGAAKVFIAEGGWNHSEPTLLIDLYGNELGTLQPVDYDVVRASPGIQTWSRS